MPQISLTTDTELTVGGGPGGKNKSDEERVKVGWQRSERLSDWEGEIVFLSSTFSGKCISELAALRHRVGLLALGSDLPGTWENKISSGYS